MNKPYELTILADDNLTEDEVVAHIKDLLVGTIYTAKYDGCKTLAYTIMGHEKAHYIYVDITLTPLEVSLLPEKLEKLNWCLRYLLSVKPTRAEKIKGIIKTYIMETMGCKELESTKLDIEGLAYKIDNKLGDNND